MHGLVQDLRFSFRQMRRSLAFVLTALFSLAFGIGATTAIFSVIFESARSTAAYRSALPLILVSAIASLLRAWRAASVNPVVALRYE
jgi:putative ABC transport system permease protein